ncbi:H-2 class II histocompatibility antigen, A-U alpha chain-like [Carassius auratus]|uniref:H-2 class II histocompatibility antigen, A-U alpha chain-like n=1 Tax=Carassius auratus TaxID=7957 RepID=A0A6P6JYH2_CARAU|nr:H-2 class II histocompatibility antigen, A-U alpha chain-like [Carassius auratus]
MELHLAILTLAVCLSADAQFIHKDFKINGCSETEKESMCGSNGDEIWHADFIQKMGVNTLPNFADALLFPGFYDLSVTEQETCQQNLAVCIKAYKSPPEEMDPPETSIYTKNDVQLGVQNSLVCHVTGFFPPPVNISWTKNNVIVKNGVSTSQYRPRDDGTFHIFSSMDIVPKEKDIYSCTVNHRALQGQVQTKIWGVPEMAAVPARLGPAVFCGAGFTLALLGAATGIFFFIKGAATDNKDTAKKEKLFKQWTYR